MIYDFLQVLILALTLVLTGYFGFRGVKINGKIANTLKSLVVESRKNSNKNTSAQLLIHFYSRYDNLMFESKGLKETDVIDWYKRFWNLQHDQFQFYEKDLIDKYIYSSWMSFRKKDFMDNESIHGISFKDGYDKSIKTLSVSDAFIGHFKKVLEDCIDPSD